MSVHPSGYYAWKQEPKSARQKDDQRIVGLIKQDCSKAARSMGIARSPRTCAIWASAAASTGYIG